MDHQETCQPYLQTLQSLRQCIEQALLLENNSKSSLHISPETMLQDIDQSGHKLVDQVQTFGADLSLNSLEKVCSAGKNLVELHLQTPHVTGSPEIQQTFSQLTTRLLKQILAWTKQLQQVLEHPEQHQSGNTKVMLELSATEEVEIIQQLLLQTSSKLNTGLWLGAAFGLGFLIGDGK